MTLLRPAALFLVLELGVHSYAWACSCIAPLGIEQSAAESDLVVYAEVVSIRDPRGCSRVISSADPMEVTLEVVDGFIGAEPGERVTITTARDGASCGVDFGVGEAWLVYAADGQTNLCSRTRPADADDPELDELAAL